MPKIVLAKSNRVDADKITIDTADILAVHHLGFQELTKIVVKGETKERFAHRREIYLKSDVKSDGDKPVDIKTLTVWEISGSKQPPSSITMLDYFGGKPSVSVARISFSGSANGSDLATANSILISTAPEDLKLITKSQSHGSKLTSTGVSSAFTMSTKPETIPKDTIMNYAVLNLGDNQTVPVAHLDATRFAKFEAV